ncbi:MAG: Holliday junction branch migration protein RuvA [Candidatus Moraniibacteriota bacterium]
MIRALRGTLGSIHPNYAIIFVGGIGYQVYASPYTLGKLAGMSDVTLHIHTHVREDQLNLFGFITDDELSMFELLISVSGVGPKAALSILAIAEPKTIRTAIVNKDPSILTRVSGVGKKTAEKVIVELQNKVSSVDIADQASALAEQDSIEALTSLGYTVSEARDALKGVPADITSVGERLKLALKSLGKK